MENKKNLLVTLADKNYINQAKQLFSSVYWNAGWKGDYMLLAHEIPEKDLKWFRDKGILIKKCKPLYDQEINGYPPIVLSKFYLFTSEFKKWKNIVYLDADIIVRASLDKIADVKYFYAVNDMDGPRLKDQIIKKENITKIENKFNLKDKSFNSGVMAFPTSMIGKNFFEELKKLFIGHKQFSRFGEQLTLNFYFYKMWEKLPLTYNFYPFFLMEYADINPKKLKGAIFHFATFDSPYSKCWDNKNFFYEEWKTNLEKAEFIDLTNIPQVEKSDTFHIYKDSFCLSGYFFLFRLRYFFLYLPDKIIGKIGLFIKKYNPGFYHKLKIILKIKTNK